MVKYYRVREKDKPEQYGLVVKVDGRKIINLTGNLEDLAEYGCCVESIKFLKKNISFLRVGKDFFKERISQETALEFKKNYQSWIMLQGYVATDSHPSSVLGNTPGTRDHSYRRY